MSFLLACPVCGPRDVYEFRYGGEIQTRPAPGSDAARPGPTYLLRRGRTSPGVERAWWFHRAGCRRWFQAERDTRDNRVLRSGWVPARRRRERPRCLSGDAGRLTGPRPRRRPLDAPDRRSGSTAGARRAATATRSASALAADGVDVLARSFKYHRPRGAAVLRRPLPELPRGGRRRARTCAPA